VIIDTGFAVGSTGAVVTTSVGDVVGTTGDAVGIPVGTAVASGKGATVGSCVSFVVGDAVFGTTGAIVGGVETRGTCVGDCSKGASLQISLPPITSTGAISEHCWPFLEGYPEFANVLPATNSNRALIPSSSTQAPQPLSSSQLRLPKSPS